MAVRSLTLGLFRWVMIDGNVCIFLEFIRLLAVKSITGSICLEFGCESEYASLV